MCILPRLTIDMVTKNDWYDSYELNVNCYQDRKRKSLKILSMFERVCVSSNTQWNGRIFFKTWEICAKSKRQSVTKF